MFGIDVEGLKEGIEECELLEKHFGELVEAFLHAFAANVIDEIRSEIQNRGSVVTGELLASVKILSEGGYEIEFGSTSEHAWYWEYGRGPVVPVEKKVLRFVTKEGVEVFAKWVAPVQGTGVFEATIIKHIEKADELWEQKVAEFKAKYNIQSAS